MKELFTPSRLLGLSFMFSGLGLFVHILTNTQLWLAVLLSFTAASSFFGCLYRVGEVNGRDVAHRIRTGLLAGCLGVVAYDVSRIITWYFWLSNAWPFEAFRLFGHGLIGESASPTAALIAGTGFHLCNGIMFAATYAVWLGNRGRLWAVGWALTLEAATLLLYPDWLEVRRFDEFLQMSILGHISYGLVLGEVVARSRPAAAPETKIAPVQAATK